MFNRTTGTKTDNHNPEESNLSPSATHSPHGIGGIQSVHRSSTNIEHPAGAQPSPQPDTDGLLVPFTNFGWLHRDESRYPPTFNYSRIMRYHVLVDGAFRILDRADLVNEVGVSGICRMKEIVLPIFNRNNSLTP